jgi:YVTN family beta-propeller protein
MRSRKVVFLAWLLALAVVIAACARTPASPTATAMSGTATPRPTDDGMGFPPTPTLTATAGPTATSAPSPTPASQVQLIGEIGLRSLPGIGHSPQALTVLGGRVYVANRTTNNVSVVEGNQVNNVIPVGAAPIALAADEATGLVYVANEGDNSISFISGDSVVRTVPAPESPSCLVALDGRLYAGGRNENVVAVLDGLSGERLATVPVSTTIGVLALAVNPVEDLLYADVYTSVQIVRLRDGATVAVLDHPTYITLAADPALQRVFVSEYDADTNQQYLVAYEPYGEKELGRAQVGGDPRGTAIDREAERIYVANSWSNDVSVLDGRSLRVIATIPTGLRPLAVAVTQDHQVYVVNSDSDNVTVIDGQTLRVLGVVPMALLPAGMAVHPVMGRLYVACASTNSVFVVDGWQVVAEIQVGLHPNDVALSEDASRLFVLNHVSGDLSVVSTSDNTVVNTVPVGQLPQGLAIAPQRGELYAGDAVLDEETGLLLRRTELLGGIRLPVKPVQIRVDSVAGRAYIVASNGVPGSNSGLVIYVTDLESGEPVEGWVGGLSTTDLALDPAGQRIFSTAGRFSYFQMIVNDALSLEQVAVVDLQSYPSALAYNPQTQHVFICLTQAMRPPWEHDAAVWVLDARGFGTVGLYPLPSSTNSTLDPYSTAVDAIRNLIYVADSDLGVVHVLRDAALPPPPSPTPTHTPTPWPTLTLEPSPTVAVQVEPACKQAPSPPFDDYWLSDRALRLALGCPSDELRSGLMAEQAFERGYMVWREADRAILVFYDDGVWRSVADRWQDGMPEISCEATAPSGLQQPKRGFGLVWCTEPGLKEGLGWAVGEEQGYTSEWQSFGHGQMMYLHGRSAIYALFSDGTFQQYAGR